MNNITKAYTTEESSTKTGNPGLHKTALVFAAVALMVLCLSRPAEAQWTTSGTNISNSNSGNVGIGTGANSPSGKLDVRQIGNTGLYSTILTSFGANEDTFIRGGSSAATVHIGDLTATTSKLLLMENGGFVGIGTNAPSRLLEVAAASNITIPINPSASTISIKNTDTTASNTADLTFRTNDAGGTTATAAKVVGVFTSHATGAISGDVALITTNAGTSAERMRVTAGGNVGIGTASPGEILNVNGTNVKPTIGAITSHTALFSTYNSQSGTGLEIAGTGTDPAMGVLALTTGNTASGNYVGSIQFATRGTSGTDKRSAVVASTLTADSSASVSGNLIFYTANASTLNEAMRIDNNGSVGIGTATPASSYKLDVAGSVNASGLCLGGDCKTAWSQVGGGGTSGSTFFGTVDGADVSATDISATAQNVGGSISFVGKYDTAGDYAGFARILGIKENGTSGNYGGALVFQTRANGGNQTEYMRVTSTGNVGVGVSNPIAKLDVRGGADTALLIGDRGLSGSIGLEFLGSGYKHAGLRFDGDNLLVENASSGVVPSTWYNGQPMNFIVRNGSLGVGTTAPGSKLFVGSGTPAGQTLAGINVALGGNSYISASNGTINTFIGSDTSSYGIVGTLTNHPLGLRANNTLAVTVMPNGSVGIGNTNPTHTLDVTGTINASQAITGATINATYQDVAEWVPSSQKLTPGTVVVLDTDHTNQVLASSKSYDTKVAGVVSAQPGISLGQGGDGKLLVATTGRVKVRVDATRAPIKVGDLLVTSDSEGVAMKSIPVDLGGTQIHRPGTIIGKALESLASGTGEILVLLSLQ